MQVPTGNNADRRSSFIVAYDIDRDTVHELNKAKFIIHRLVDEGDIPCELFELDSITFIIDCRLSFYPTSKLAEQFGGLNNSCKRFVSILNGTFEERFTSYSLGYDDYIAFPFIVREVEQRLATIEASPAQSGPTFSNDPIVQSACEVMMLNVTSSISADGVALQVGTNRNTLSRKFHAEFGVSPIAWWRRERLRRARDLLKHTSMKIADIADSIGYPDANNFSTTFRRVFGHSPRAFREQNAVCKGLNASRKGFARPAVEPSRRWISRSDNAIHNERGPTWQPKTSS